MSNTTEEYWDVNGTSLNTWAHNIETLGGRSGIPTFRGSDLKVPYQAGQVWRPKLPDSRVIVLAMWARDSDADGVVPGTLQGRRIKINENMRAIKELFFQTDGNGFSEQIELTKRWRETSGLIVAKALAEVVSSMEPAMFGRYSAKFTVDLKLADPYFYDTTTPTTKYL